MSSSSCPGPYRVKEESHPVKDDDGCETDWNWMMMMTIILVVVERLAVTGAVSQSPTRHRSFFFVALGVVVHHSSEHDIHTMTTAALFVSSSRFDPSHHHHHYPALYNRHHHNRCHRDQRRMGKDSKNISSHPATCDTDTGFGILSLYIWCCKALTSVLYIYIYVDDICRNVRCIMHSLERSMS